MTNNEQPPSNPWDRPDSNAPEQQNSPSYGAPADSSGASSDQSPYGAPSYQQPSASDFSANPYEQQAQSSSANTASANEAPSYTPTGSAPAFGSANDAQSQYGAPSFGGAPAASQGAAQGGQVPAGEPTPGEDLGNDISKSFSWTFRAFGKNLVPLLVPGLIWGLAALIFAGIGTVGLTIGLISLDEREFFGLGAFLATLIGFLLAALTGLFWITGITNAVGMIARGDKPSLKDGLFCFRLIPLMIVIGLIVSIGYMLLVLPGIIASVLFMYAPYAAAVDRLGIGAALKASIDAVMKKPLLAIVMLILMSVISSISGAVFIGIFIAAQIAGLLYTAAYMRSTGRVPSEAQAS